LFEETGMSFSGAAVSDWERGASKIHADHRPVLVGLLKVLCNCGGLKTPAEANQLLEAGNYRDLNVEEIKSLFGDGIYKFSAPAPNRQISVPRFILERVFFDSPDEFQNWLTFVEEGPLPVWPRLAAALLRRLSQRLSASSALRALIWLWVWILAFVLIAPSMNWPYSNQEAALVVIGLYVSASLILPLFIGALINTDKNAFWQQNKEASPAMVRLYVYQGAFIGFHIGYFAVFAANLLLFFFHAGFVTWMQFALLGFPIVMGYVVAHVVPYNLWRAYGRLRLADGAVFFVFSILGPFWGWFFIESYQLLLTPFTGIFIVLAAFTLLVGVMAWQFHRKGGTT
jgi:hypothetical protein